MFDEEQSQFVPVTRSGAAQKAESPAFSTRVAAAEDDVSTFVGAVPRPAAPRPAAPAAAAGDDVSTFVGAVPRPAAPRPAAPAAAAGDDVSTFVGAVPRPAAPRPAALAAAAGDDVSTFVGAVPRPAAPNPAQSDDVSSFVGAVTPRPGIAETASPPLSVPAVPLHTDVAPAAKLPVASVPQPVSNPHPAVQHIDNKPADDNFLPDGTLLNNTYRITLCDSNTEKNPDGSPKKVPLGQGGFGITYLAVDEHLGRRVVIKENFPLKIAVRRSDLSIVSTMAGQSDDPYEMLRTNFTKEARIIAGVKERHPNIVDITAYFMAFGTSYYVMPYVEGSSLKSAITSRKWDEASVRFVLQGALSGLAYLHEMNVLHLDIKPDNILMKNNQIPVLIDFGASIGSDMPNEALVYSAGYAPPEQCSVDIATQLGPWSDIYALGATMYHVITGEKPGKKSLPLTQLAKSYPKFSRAFLASIDKAMHPEIKHRWSSAKEWLDLYQSMDQITRDANRLF